MKKILSAILLTAVFALPVEAFTYNATLEDQIELMDGLTLSESTLTLEKGSIEAIGTTPNFSNDSELYVKTSTNHYYWNNEFAPNFSDLDNVPEACLSTNCLHRFIDEYGTLGYQLYASSDSIYLSYDRGQTWQLLQPDLAKNIQDIDFGPRFVLSHLFFITTIDGVFTYNSSNDQTNLILGNDNNNESMIFRYPFSTSSDQVYYISDGTTLRKTEDGGQTWLKKEFNEGIKNYYVIPNGPNTYRVIVITQDDKLMAADYNLDFFSLSLPETLEISSFSWVQEDGDTLLYLLYTDKGFYYTYDKASAWTHRSYEELQNISDYLIKKSGTQYLLFILSGGKIYRDINFENKLVDYNKGINLSYINQGEASSKNVLDFSDENFADGYEVAEATLMADGDLNGQSLKLFMSVDGGTQWDEVESGNLHQFEVSGLDLRWKAELSTADPSISPVLRSVRIDYGMDKVGNDMPTTCQGFSDIEQDSDLCDAITYVKEMGIFEGYPDGTFRAMQPINRAETVKVIGEGFDLPIIEDDGTAYGFSDVIRNEWYMKYLATAKEAGIIQGYPDGTFKPEQTVNYVEMLKIFFETADVQLPDSNENSQWYEKYLTYARQNDLIFQSDLEAPMTRGDVAELFFEWSQLNKSNT